MSTRVHLKWPPRTKAATGSRLKVRKVPLDSPELGRRYTPDEIKSRAAGRY
jgi:hypothetical protein